MKKLVKLLSLIAIVLMMFVPSVLLAAKVNVIDNAGLLSENQLKEVEAYAQKISKKHSIDVIILTTLSTEGKDIVAYADDYYDANGFGYGKDRSGLMLVIDMGNRETYITTTGLAIKYITDYGADYLGKEVRTDLSNADYYKGFYTFISNVDAILTRGESGNIFDIYYNRLAITISGNAGDRISAVYSVYDANNNYIDSVDIIDNYGYIDILTEKPDPTAKYYLKCEEISSRYNKVDVEVKPGEYNITIVVEKQPLNLFTVAGITSAIGAVISFITCSILKGKNKSVYKEYAAHDYVRNGSLQLNTVRDIYLYSHTSRTPIPKPSDNDHGSGFSGGSFSGGSSTHTSSSGSTHGGGGRGSF